MTEIVGKIFFDDILFVAAADDEFIDTVVAVSFHDMPQDGLSSDFNHRFGYQIGGFAQTCTETTGNSTAFMSCLF